MVYDMNQQYWGDLVYEGEKLTEFVEGAPRDLSEDIADTAAGRAQTHRDGERYRDRAKQSRTLNLDRPEHRLQDVIDAYRWHHPETDRPVPRGIGRTRPDR
ncbi:hypothetical protein [uncultured Gordonia sp.]|uniref:hypothetical protein n=1 Tax=uncultured Gordonia sp. TaxID=198437 RepID=UPI00261E121A|nr:hypothetical protein [uncultured Gordonia sp.]